MMDSTRLLERASLEAMIFGIVKYIPNNTREVWRVALS